MGVMDFFRSSGPTTSSAAPSTPAAANPNLNGQTTPVGPDGKMPGSSQLPVNPLDAYKNLFDDANKSPDTPPAFTLDPKVLGEVSGSLNFTQGISPELMQKATTGDITSLIELINQVGQQAYKASLHHSTALTDKFVGARSEYDLGKVGSRVKAELTSSELATNPAYQHPVVKEQLNRIAAAMRKENPDASPQEIAKAAARYIKDIADAVYPQGNKDSSQQGSSDEIDWTKYLGS